MTGLGLPYELLTKAEAASALYSGLSVLASQILTTEISYPGEHRSLGGQDMLLKFSPPDLQEFPNPNPSNPTCIYFVYFTPTIHIIPVA